MRIPTEALLPYPADSGRFAEAPGTRPVPSSANLTGQLPESLPRTRQTPLPLPERDESAARSEREGEPPQQERRHEDRRYHSAPVTLDTRLTRSRRKPKSPEINIEI
jgi:hypothetical protein